MLEGMVAIVTGAGRGIGAATARLLAKQKVSVVCAARTQSEIEAVAAEINEAGGKALAVVCDLEKTEHIKALAAKALEHFGDIHILINNAGYVSPANLVDMDEAVFRRTIDVNLTATYLCCKAALPNMLKNGRGSIVNVASISGVKGTSKFPGFTAYAAAKAGVILLTEALGAELAGTGVRVNAISPGSVDTRMLKDVAPHVEPGMSPEEVAAAILYLVSEPARPINGTNVEIFG